MITHDIPFLFLIYFEPFTFVFLQFVVIFCCLGETSTQKKTLKHRIDAKYRNKLETNSTSWKKQIISAFIKENSKKIERKRKQNISIYLAVSKSETEAEQAMES